MAAKGKGNSGTQWTRISADTRRRFEFYSELEQSLFQTVTEDQISQRMQWFPRQEAGTFHMVTAADLETSKPEDKKETPPNYPWRSTQKTASSVAFHYTLENQQHATTVRRWTLGTTRPQCMMMLSLPRPSPRLTAVQVSSTFFPEWHEALTMPHRVDPQPCRQDRGLGHSANTLL